MMKYPGRYITHRESDVSIQNAVRARLREKMPDLHDLPQTGRIDKAVRSAIKMFQSRNVDGAGRPLKDDGIIGPLTWAALFGDDYATDWITHKISSSAVLTAYREAERGVREDPRNSNRGDRVEDYLASVGLPGGYSWCQAFVYWCFEQAAHSTGADNPVPRTAGVLDHWRKAPGAGGRRIKTQTVLANPSLLTPGMVFIMNHGRGLGHTGIVEKVRGGLIHTIEGNTDASRTREGGGVYRLTRKISDINTGFIDYSQS